MKNMITDKIFPMMDEMLKSLRFEVDHKKFLDGDFGDLNEYDLKLGDIMGHISVWSSGMIFYGFIDSSKDENYEIIQEKFLDATDMSDSELIYNLKDVLNSRLFRLNNVNL
ncbi:hypothetical protein PUR29_26610 [Methylobacterium ajmalii]|uniref:DinB-like domain-containing protein n=1 Tax=Methylobacterium ajmalii TaxID=2738439 RepID=A0ABV0A0I1_9HYPH